MATTMVEGYSSFVDNNGIRVKNTPWVNDTDSNGYPAYDPDYPVPKWNQDMEMIVINVTNLMTLLIMVSRTCFRYRKLKTLRADDKWIIAACIVLVFVYWPAQIVCNVFGAGLYWKNIPIPSRESFWIGSWGYCGYFMITSMIKVSICFCHLHIMPRSFKLLRRFLYGLCVFIMVLGTFEACLWLFDCVPFASNFNWDVMSTACLNLDIPRYCWLGLSVIIDIIILWIPFRILQESKLKCEEKTVLMQVFSANLLGTATCIVGFYGIWSDRMGNKVDLTFAESAFVMTNDIEILFYTLGASFPVLSPYLISWKVQNASSKTTSFTSLPSLRSRDSRYDREIRQLDGRTGDFSVISQAYYSDSNPVISKAEKSQTWDVRVEKTIENEVERVETLQKTRTSQSMV